MAVRQQLDELLENKNVRNNLSQLRQSAKDEAARRMILGFAREHGDVLEGFLADEDAKTRRNAALLLGEIRWKPAQEAVYEAYQREETRFIRSSYLQALADMGYEGHNQELHARLDALMEEPESEETRKHNEEEIRALHRLLIAQEGIERHIFDVTGKKVTVLLLTNHEHREFIRSKVPVGRAAIHPLGVLVETDELRKLMRFRLYREMVFPIALRRMQPADQEFPEEARSGRKDAASAAQASKEDRLLQTIRKGESTENNEESARSQIRNRTISTDPREAAHQLAESNLYLLLTHLHREAGTFYFRLDVQNTMTLEERSVFAKKLSAELEKCTQGKLVNSTSNYEVEIRLIATKGGRYFPCLRLAALPDRRFSYRRNALAASIHPSDAALMMELAAGYLKEDAQIMDPFCGVGTMLIERNYHTHARNMYATDIFADAIEKGQENADKAQMWIHFINRDFFTFTHGYPFDELISNMPARGKKTKDEQDRLYADFFAKAAQICGDGAKLILYSNEMGFIKKQLRLHKEFQMLQETLIRKTGEYYLFVIEYHRAGMV